ncbi:protein FAM136A [Iris pallida]|uniref:Protein FAM136A n=1 Tax=Iris pallida TaxID=29817 RepID=A0AAX6HB94_IRIPA|nr:protein FAM136A [Iris pallida]
MDHLASLEDKLVSDRMRRKLEEVNVAVQSHLHPIQDHVNFTLQQAYFKCAHDCFDRRRRQEEIDDCVERCSVPVLNANILIENEMAKFQERMNRSLMVCQDKFETAKLQQIKTGAMQDMEVCVNQAIEDSVRVLPHVVDRLKASLSID